MLLSILDDRSARRVADALVARGLGVTQINTVGGFLRRGNATLIVGVEDGDVEAALATMRAAYAQGGGADAGGSPTGPVFVLGAAELVQL